MLDLLFIKLFQNEQLTKKKKTDPLYEII